ncbi:transglutaminase-like domain-containing protein [Streptomyces sp. UNOC14_S4]|uniref:transglutaminase-like domain-containing protein n=1 Tax=Streptomyces sp. UNOC14_S4 TaxID=2872340 RepID=UPI001E62ECBE|nr:transglutaminase-like domain-containing protein [Streptomyces sp. UNOC14_S4]MCC3769059.1 transglutaminase-like domain-containing protein [Streptomyces sp. UNOC14_S4]
MHDITDRRRRRFAEAARDERPDLALLCLLIAAEADPDADPDAGESAIDEAQIELDRLAGLLPAQVRGAGPVRWATALEDLLGTRLGFRGSPSDYRRLESSLLDQVLLRRRGLPIMLSVVWTEVARRAGAPVYGVALPGHFVVGFGDPYGEHVLADPFDGGRLLSEEEAGLLVAGATGTPVAPSMFSPADPLEIVLRVLNNIRAWAAARPERSDVQLWAVDLALLLPSHPARLRFERAELLVERGDFAGGAREMEDYARVIDAVEPSVAESVRHRARAARAMLN